MKGRSLPSRLACTCALAGLALSGAVSTAAAQALPSFTLNPAAATPPLLGTAFTADNILISDFSTVTLSGSTFTDAGFLSVSAFQLGGTTIIPTGLNSTYGLYIAFVGSGTTTPGDPRTIPTFGSFTSLNYTLYGYNGTASFGFSGNTPTETASGEIVLATGSLMNGSVSSVPTVPNDGTFTPSASARLTFAVAPGQQAFFASPNPFYSMALTAFANTTSEVEPFEGGYRIRQGGGSVNFTNTVPTTTTPEPATLPLLLTGFSAIGWFARRRRA